MKPILKQGIILLGCLALLYMIMLGAAVLLVRSPDHGAELSTAVAHDTIFMTEPKYVFLNRTPLRKNTGKVVLVGASNVATGFDLSELQPLVPATVAVHNLAIGGANMTEVRQVIDLVQEVQSKEARRREIFVLGIWYGMFGEDRLRWYTAERSPGDTDIDIERYRYGFARRSASGPVELVPWRYVDVAVTAIYPFLALDKLARDALALVSRAYSARPKDLDTVVVSEADKIRMLNYWSGVMGPARPAMLDEQFAVLEQSCEAVLAEGSTLVLVDLPLPRWHQERSPYESSYQDHKTRLVQRWTDRPRFAYFDMAGLDTDDDFYDEVHPKPHVTAVWAKRLAAALSPLLARGTSVAGSKSGGSAPETHLQ